VASGSEQTNTRFPWGYLVASLLPIGLIGAIFALPALLGPRDSMGPAMLCSLLIGPVGALVVGWGLVRLWRGEGRRFPALRWLVWLPALVGVAGFMLG
jgi:hypothetical protein